MTGMTRRIPVVATILVLLSVFLFTSGASAATFSGNVVLGCDGYTSSGNLDFTVDDGEGSESVGILAIDAAYSDPIATPSVTLLDTTQTGDVGTSAPLESGTWATPPTHNPLFLSLSDGNGSVFWETFGVCDALPWAQPLVGTPGGSVPHPGGSLNLVVASCWGTSAYAQLTQDGHVLSTVQTSVFALPPGGAAIPLENELALPIPADVAAGSTVSATVVCGTSANPLSPPGDISVLVLGSSTPTSSTTQSSAGTTAPRFTG
jgi:hypothetical protein